MYRYRVLLRPIAPRPARQTRRAQRARQAGSPQASRALTVLHCQCCRCLRSVSTPLPGGLGHPKRCTGTADVPREPRYICTVSAGSENPVIYRSNSRALTVLSACKCTGASAGTWALSVLHCQCCPVMSWARRLAAPSLRQGLARGADRICGAKGTWRPHCSPWKPMPQTECVTRVDGNVREPPLQSEYS